LELSIPFSEPITKSFLPPEDTADFLLGVLVELLAPFVVGGEGLRTFGHQVRTVA
jgi:hypothetical protein